MPFLSDKQLNALGLRAYGSNVKISDKASLYGCANISIGNNVRIDDFCVLSAGEGGITIKNNVHIAINASIIGAGEVLIEDFCGISARVAIYSSNDDYSGEYMSNPTVPEEFTNVNRAPVAVGKHVIIGAGSVVLPGVVIEEGAVIGALSLVNTRCERFGIYAGVPAKRIKERKTKLLELEKRYLNTLERG